MMYFPNLINIKNSENPCNWKIIMEIFILILFKKINKESEIMKIICLSIKIFLYLIVIIPKQKLKTHVIIFISFIIIKNLFETLNNIQLLI